MSISGQSPTMGQGICSGSCSSHLASQDLLHPQHRPQSWYWGFAAARPRATSDITGSLGDKTEASRAAEPRREVDSYRDRFRANPKDAEAALTIWQGAAGHGAAGPSGRGARAGDDRSPRQQGAAGRLWAGTGGQRQFPASLRRPQPRPYALTIPIGGSSRRKAPRSINSAGTRRRGSTMRAR